MQMLHRTEKFDKNFAQKELATQILTDNTQVIYSNLKYF